HAGRAAARISITTASRFFPSRIDRALGRSARSRRMSKVITSFNMPWHRRSLAPAGDRDLGGLLGRQDGALALRLRRGARRRQDELVGMIALAASRAHGCVVGRAESTRRRLTGRPVRDPSTNGPDISSPSTVISAPWRYMTPLVSLNRNTSPA